MDSLEYVWISISISPRMLIICSSCNYLLRRTNGGRRRQRSARYLQHIAPILDAILTYRTRAHRRPVGGQWRCIGHTASSKCLLAVAILSRCAVAAPATPSWRGRGFQILCSALQRDRVLSDVEDEHGDRGDPDGEGLAHAVGQVYFIQ